MCSTPIKIIKIELLDQYHIITFLKNGVLPTKKSTKIKNF